MPAPGNFQITVEADQARMRLDVFLSLNLPDCSRSQAAALIRQGVVVVGGTPQKAGYKVKAHEQISGRVPSPASVDLISEPLALDIVFEDGDLIVVNKPAGLVVHPAAGHPSGTLVNGLLHHCADLEGIGGERRPGIVHRLDKDTSGVMVVAKNDRSHQALSGQFKDRSVKKIYLAIVNGSLAKDRGTIDLPVGRHPSKRKKMSTASPRGREASTRWQVRQRLSGTTLLEVELKTGRTHQIRVHCQAMGHPIVGDPVYGQRRAMLRQAKSDAGLYQVLKNTRRQMLHAARLTISHPSSGERLTFEAPMPEDMADVLTALQVT